MDSQTEHKLMGQVKHLP